MRLTVLLVGVVLAAAACGGTKVPGRSGPNAKRLIAAYGCGACHTIPGVENATATVGPSLDGLGDRRTIAGRLANTTENLTSWIENPQRIDPGNLMPNLGLGQAEAAAIAAYLERH